MLLTPCDTGSCSPIPNLFVALGGDNLGEGTRSSNSTSCAFLVAGSVTSDSSTMQICYCIGVYDYLRDIPIWCYCNFPFRQNSPQPRDSHTVLLVSDFFQR